MADVSNAVTVMPLAGFWSAVGRVIYWPPPNRLEGSIRFLKRVGLGLGLVDDAATNELGRVPPIEGSGARGPGGRCSLVGVGLVGLWAVATFLPHKLNEAYRKQMQEPEHAGAG